MKQRADGGRRRGEGEKKKKAQLKLVEGNAPLCGLLLSIYGNSGHFKHFTGTNK